MKAPRPLVPLRLPFDCSFDLPGSKSEANRALVLAALANGICRIEGATLGDDVLYMTEALIALGFDLDIADPEAGTIEVVGGIPDIEDEGEIYCGNAGTVLRFLVSVAALVPGEWTLTGDAYLRKRPIRELVEAWQALGLDIRDTDGGLPVTIIGGRRKGGRVKLDARRSGQFLSSLLLVGHTLEGGLEIELADRPASLEYVALTQETMARFGLRVETEPGLWRVAPTRAQAPAAMRIEGDWSAAGAMSVLAELSSSRFKGRNLKERSRQADRRVDELITAMRADGDIEIDLSATPDQLMNLAVLAARRTGSCRFVGAGNLRFKECDRLAVTAREFRRAGISVAETDDGLIVTGTSKLDPCLFDPENDHRLAMALALIGSMHPGFSLINSGCVAKSYPGFFAQLDRAHREHRPIAIVGMRASGKTTLGRALAASLGSAFVDTDELFVARRGAIADFVAAQGWDEFRRIEREIVAESLVPGRVTALGGGALEDEDARRHVAEKALVVHVDEDLAVIRDRLRRDNDRPALTGKGLLEELPEIHERRRPQFAEIADFRVAPGLATEQQVAQLTKELAASCSW